MRTAFQLAVAGIAALTYGPGDAVAQTHAPTRVTVRAVASDAKVIYDKVGGARITITETATGRVLAEGIQQGTSGDTPRIMTEPRTRGDTLYATPGTAGFSAELPLERPTLVTVRAEGPMAADSAWRGRTATTLLLVPGRHLEGDGIVLEIHGLLVAIDSATAGGGEVPVVATVMMACGCPTRPEGLWDSKRLRVTARLLQDDRIVAEAPLEYAGRESTYSGRVRAPAGRYTLEVLAVDEVGVNAGLDRREIELGG